MLCACGIICKWQKYASNRALMRYRNFTISLLAWKHFAGYLCIHHSVDSISARMQNEEKKNAMMEMWTFLHFSPWCCFFLAGNQTKWQPHSGRESIFTWWKYGKNMQSRRSLEWKQNWHRQRTRNIDREWNWERENNLFFISFHSRADGLIHNVKV